MRVVDYAPTRVWRQVRQARQARTPVWSPAVVAIDPDPGSGPLAHPRLVRRARPPTPAPNAPPQRMTTERDRVITQRDREFDDEPTARRCQGSMTQT